MNKELKSTQVCYGEDVLMMRVDDCLIFGNKDALQKLAKKLEGQTAKVIKHHYEFNSYKDNFFHGLGGTELLCDNCKKKVLDGDDYCSHCGAKLDWSENE